MNALASFTPILAVSVGSLLYLVTGRALERRHRAASVAALLIAAAMVLLCRIPDSIGESEYGFVVNDFSRLFAMMACLGALLSVVSTAGAAEREGIGTINEYYFLLLTSLAGAMVMVFATDYLSLFIGVEVASLALYCLCGSRVSQRSGSEASMKYFLLGCFSSAFLLLGIAFWYGATGSLSMVVQDEVPYNTMVFLSFLMVLVGMAFKLGLAPFHLWVPDVYQGAPTSVTTFMSCIVKVAAFGALLKVLVLGYVYPQAWSMSSLWLLAALAMTVGNLAALQQRSVKRMLAYSSVAQAGYILVGTVATAYGADGIVASLYYLMSYCCMTIGAFAVLSAVGPDADDIAGLRGLAKRSPFLAGCMTLFFLGLAGLPPGLAGLMGKVLIFSEALSYHLYGLAILGVLNSALACAYYFRVPVAMYFQPGSSDEGRIPVTIAAVLAIGACALAVVLFGIFPEPLLAIAGKAAGTLVGR